MSSITLIHIRELEILKNFLNSFKAEKIKRGLKYKITKKTKFYKEFNNKFFLNDVDVMKYVLDSNYFFIPSIKINDLDFRLIDNKMFLNSEIFSDKYKKNSINVFSNNLKDLQLDIDSLVKLEVDEIIINFNC